MVITSNSKELSKAVGKFITKYPGIVDNVTYGVVTNGKKVIIQKVNQTTNTRTGALKRGFVVVKESMSEYAVKNIATSSSKSGIEYYANDLEYGTRRGIEARNFVKDSIPEIEKKFKKDLSKMISKMWGMK